jgi:alpha-1,6-mannosyltransferase
MTPGAGAQTAELTPMKFLDINTFFSGRAGGIRTYYNAKISFFGQQSDHSYLLVYPGPRHAITVRSPAVTLVEAYGPEISRDRGAYRFLLDYFRVYLVIRSEKTDVVEVGDPWFTGLFCLTIKKLGLYRGLLACFCHSDPVATHVLPWSRQGSAQALKRALVLRPFAALFYRAQRAYDLTVVASQELEESLRAQSIKVVRMPLGVPALFLEGREPVRPRPSGGRREVRLLYSGRLNQEKGIRLIQAVLPRLLALEHISVTVMGRGGAADHFARLQHPRFRYLGFIGDAAEVRSICDDHDVLLAPGPHESFGLSVIEAMARGMVVVGPDQGATGERLRQAGSPFIFQAGSADDFFRVILMAIDCDQQAESTRSRGIAVSHGTLEQAMGRLVGLYAKLSRDR